MASSTFRWENAEVFTSLANLLSLRKGACLGPMERRDDDTEDNMNSAHACAGDDLERRFLDGFAKVMSRNKGGECVACVALRESRNITLEEPDGVKVTLLVARNEAFGNEDCNFCNKVERLLAALGASARINTENPTVEQALWEAMLDYNEPRIEQYTTNFQKNLHAFARSGYLDSIPLYCLAQALDSCQGAGTAFCDSNEIGPYSKATHNAYMQFAQAHLRELLDVFSFGDRAVQRCLLAERAYFIRHMYSVRIFINASCNDLGSRLLSDIDFLGRLRSCYYTLVEAAETIPGFANLSIMLVDKPASHNLPPALPSLDDLFKWLGLPLNPATVQKFVGDMTIATVRQDFLKLQRKAFFQTLATHAEIQLVFYIAQRMHPETVTKEFHPYIGCSKLCCFLCFTFLRFFGQYGPFFKVRGCHGRVYPLWSLPDADGLHVDMCMELYLALRKTLGHMSREMTRAVATSPHHKVESSAGITDDYSVPSSYIHDYHAELTIQSKFHALRAALAAKSSSDKAHEVVANSDLEDDRAELTRYTSFPLRSGKCAHCDKKTSRKCSKCTGPWLCSKMCEGIYDFYDHNFKCAIRRPLDSADYLERACWENEIPDDIDTLEEYGFIKFPSAFDRRNLLGVFIGLTHMGIGSRELRKWQEDGMLLANITSTYEGKPEYGRGECYEWFRENIYILNRTDAQTYIRDQFAIVRPYLDVGDQSKDPHELVPNAKRKSFLLYAILFNGWHPDPSHSEKSIQDLYYTFGFCLCCDIGSEQVLARLYMMLICRCSFQEFWLAYQNHSLVALMDAKGLEKARQNIQHLEGFLKIKPNDWCPTVWHLRLFTQSRAALPGRYVARDYGFFNCETVEEQFALKETYKRLLEIPKVDPMELHVACIQGELYGFARTHLPDLQWRFGKIMKNSYPTHADVEGAGEWRWASPVHCQSGWSCENSVVMFEPV